MKLILIIAVFGLPTAEIITFIEIGGILGLGPTIGIILLTAIIGAVQLKLQGSATLYKVMECLNQGRFPIDEAFDGCCLILASILLLTPGFITDFVGLLLFAPLFRVNLRRLLARYIFATNHININNSNIYNTPDPPDPHEGMILDGEFDDVTATQEKNEFLPARDSKVRRR